MRVIDGEYVEMEINIVDGNLPLIVGLGIMNKAGFILDYGKNSFTDQSRSWELPITYQYRHYFVHDDASNMYLTRVELERLHLQFYHPSASKLYALLKRRNGPGIDPNIKPVLKKIIVACATCQEYHFGPFRFGASILPDEILFDHKIANDLMWLTGKPVLKEIDTDTSYQNDEFVRSKSIE